MTDARSTILVLSDTHLGRGRGGALSVQALRPLWQSCDRLVLNGDAVEIQDPRHWAGAARALMQLREWTERDGVDLVVLSGNHDPHVSDRRHLLEAGGSILITHGDALHPAVAPWSHAAPQMQAMHERLSAEHGDGLCLDTVLQIARRASSVEWDAAHVSQRHSSLLDMACRPWAAMKVLRYWRRFPALAARFAARFAPESRFVITGHSHRQGIWPVGERTVINTGSFGFPGRPRGVIIDERGLRVHDIVRRHGRYEMLANARWSVEESFQIPQPLAFPSAANTRPGSARPSREAI